MDFSNFLTPDTIKSGTAIGLLLANKELVKEVTVKLLGPSAEYVGDLSKRFLEHAFEKQPRNIANIFIKAIQKIGNKVDEQGAVEPRILKQVIEDGAFIENEIVAEYYAGILASSRTEEGKNDDGLPYLKIMQAMSAFDILLHSILYKTVQHAFSDIRLRVGDPADRRKMRIFIPYLEIESAIKKYTVIIADDEVHAKITDSLFRFAQNNLIDNGWGIGDKDLMNKAMNCQLDIDGLHFAPSAVGVGVALWGYGYGSLTKEEFYDCDFMDDLQIAPIENVIKVSYRNTQ